LANETATLFFTLDISGDFGSGSHSGFNVSRDYSSPFPRSNSSERSISHSSSGEYVSAYSGEVSRQTLDHSRMSGISGFSSITGASDFRTSSLADISLNDELDLPSDDNLMNSFIEALSPVVDIMGGIKDIFSWKNPQTTLIYSIALTVLLFYQRGIAIVFSILFFTNSDLFMLKFSTAKSKLPKSNPKQNAIIVRVSLHNSALIH